MFRLGKRALRRIIFNQKFDGRAPFRFKWYQKHFPDMTYDDAVLIHRFDDLTLTGALRQAALLQAIRYLNDRAIGGDIVECGVWRGGAMLLAKALCEKSPLRRDYYLFDTFAGMSEPTDADITHDGRSAVGLYDQDRKPTHSEWCYASLEDVRENFRVNCSIRACFLSKARSKRRCAIRKISPNPSRSCGLIPISTNRQRWNLKSSIRVSFPAVF